VRIRKCSNLTGNWHDREVPVSQHDLDQWYATGISVQRAFPHLSADDREFLLTGITPEEWAGMFPEGDE
jgi:hypothetical protein